MEEIKGRNKHRRASEFHDCFQHTGNGHIGLKYSLNQWSIDNKTPYEYDERFYYKHNEFLCVSDQDGSNEKILMRYIIEEESPSYFEVNSTGIYFFYLEDTKFKVRCFDLYGAYKSTYEDTFSSKNAHICLYDNLLYWTYSEERPVMVFDKFNYSPIYVYDMDTQIKELLFDEPCLMIEKLYANKDKVVFLGAFAHSHHLGNDEWIEVDSTTFMGIDRNGTGLQGISNPHYRMDQLYLDVRDIVTGKKEMFSHEVLWEKIPYNMDIVTLDMENEILWVREKSEHIPGYEFWVPKELWGDRSKTKEGVKAWRVPEGVYGQQIYFDGEYFLVVNNNILVTIDQNGNVHEFPLDIRLFGSFYIIGDYLRVRKDFSREGLFRMENGVIDRELQRENWMGTDRKLDENAINHFEMLESFRKGFENKRRN